MYYSTLKNLLWQGNSPVGVLGSVNVFYVTLQLQVFINGLRAFTVENIRSTSETGEAVLRNLKIVLANARSSADNTTACVVRHNRVSLIW